MDNPLYPRRRVAGSKGDGYAIYSNRTGVFLGPGVPLLRRVFADGEFRFEPRPLEELNRLFGAAYGRAYDATPHLGALDAAARKLDQRDWFGAGYFTARSAIMQLANDNEVARLVAADAELRRAGHDVSGEPRAPPGQPDGGEWTDPWPGSPITRQFRQKLHEKESKGESNHGYAAKNKKSKALGRYQLSKAAQREVGLRIGENWNPHNKYGAKTEADFLKDKVAQEKALADYMKSNERQLIQNGATKVIGQHIDGVESDLTVTLSGLAAAAHREGAGRVQQYLEWQKENGWHGDASSLSEDDPRRGHFLNIETRLREFQNTPHRGRIGHGLTDEQ